MEFLEVLTEGLERVLMVRGGGREVITIYSWRHFAISFPHPHHCVLHLHIVWHHVYSHTHDKNLCTEWSLRVRRILQYIGSQNNVTEGCFFEIWHCLCGWSDHPMMQFYLQILNCIIAIYMEYKFVLRKLLWIFIIFLYLVTVSNLCSCNCCTNRPIVKLA